MGIEHPSDTSCPSVLGGRRAGILFPEDLVLYPKASLFKEPVVENLPVPTEPCPTNRWKYTEMQNKSRLFAVNLKNKGCRASAHHLRCLLGPKHGLVSRGPCCVLDRWSLPPGVVLRVGGMALRDALRGVDRAHL